jgi:hypothetical protein
MHHLFTLHTNLSRYLEMFRLGIFQVAFLQMERKNEMIMNCCHAVMVKYTLHI